MSDPLPPTPPPSPVPPDPYSSPVPPPPGVPPVAPAVSAIDQQWAIGLHLSGLLGLLGCSIPAINIIGPLVIWLLKRPASPHIDAVGKRVLNFQISYAIYMAACWIGFFLLSVILIGFLFLPLVGVVFVAWIVLTIIGAIKESNGEVYRFPFTIEFLK